MKVNNIKTTQIAPKTSIQSGNQIINSGGRWRIYTGNEEEGKGRFISIGHIEDLISRGVIKKVQRKDIEKGFYYHVL